MEVRRVGGVRSTWLALAMNCRWLVKARSSRRRRSGARMPEAEPLAPEEASIRAHAVDGYSVVDRNSKITLVSGLSQAQAEAFVENVQDSSGYWDPEIVRDESEQ
jgi:hypothetical protein